MIDFQLKNTLVDNERVTCIGQKKGFLFYGIRFSSIVVIKMTSSTGNT